jgi:hypothetical protein
MKGVWKFVFLGVGIAIAVFAGIFFLVMRLTQPYVDIVETQRVALAGGDSATAYETLSLAARDEISQADFVAMMDGLGVWKQDGSYSFRSRNVENGVGRLTGVYTRDDGAVVPVTFVVVREQDELRVISFQFGN